VIKLTANPLNAISGEKVTLSIVLEGKITDLSSKCLIYWKNTKDQEGIFYKDIDIETFNNPQTYTIKKDSTKQTYIQVRCANQEIFNYYSNTVTVELKEKDEDKGDKKQFGLLTVKANQPVTLFVTRLENGKETLVIQKTSKIENVKLLVGSYVIYSSLPAGYQKPAD